MKSLTDTASLLNNGESVPNRGYTIVPGGEAMKKYVCDVCGYVYDPAKGEATGKVPPGTAFEDLPVSWTCPVCGAPRSRFSPEED